MEKEKKAKPRGDVKKIVKKLNNKITWILLSAFVILVCFFGIVGLGAIQLGWDNSFTNAIVKIFPYPAAVVNGKIIKYSDWKYETEAVLLLSSKRLNAYSEEDVKKEVLQKMIYDELMETLARKHGIKVTSEDLDAMQAELVSQVGSEEELEKNVREFFNWDLETFRKRVVYSDVLRDKLQKELPLSEKNVKEAEKKANEVLVEVKKGEKSFEELAQVYSEDPGSAAQGGDLGWFPRGVMVKEFEDAAFSLNPGEISDLIKTDFGYHIIKLNQKKSAEEADDGVEQISASHILIKTKTFDDYLAELEKSALIYKFVALDNK